MVHHQRHHLRGKKAETGFKEEGEEENSMAVLGFARSKSVYSYRRSGPKLLFLLLLSLLSCFFISFSYLFSYSSAFSLLYNLGVEDGEVVSLHAGVSSTCSSMSQGTICCDRSSLRSDTCYVKGDVRTQSSSSSIFLYASENTNGFTNYINSMAQEEGEKEAELEIQHEKIKPYTRKWETSVMDTIDELDLISLKSNSGIQHECEVQHDAPALFFSTGGYTGNVYHEFNDGIIPLYITSQHLNKKVVFVILKYRNWWISKYGDIISLLSDYRPIDFSNDKRIHCFREAIVGLRIHDELTVDSSLMEGNKGIRHFRNLLDQSYLPRIRSLIEEEESKQALEVKDAFSPSPSSGMPLEAEKVALDKIPRKPKLVILSRNGSRAITNEGSMVEMAEELGFQVEIFRPGPTTELAKIYRVLNSSDAMVGVHGAAMTHFLFLRPGSLLIQVIPLGTQWAAETCYGEPAKKLGLKYIDYKILPRESSLYNKYHRSDPILRDPQSVANMGWEFTKKIYLDDQNVGLDLRRFKKRLVDAYEYCMSRRRRQCCHKSTE